MDDRLTSGISTDVPLTEEQTAQLLRRANLLSQLSNILCGKDLATLEELLHGASQVKAELEAVKRERDALLADLCMLAIKRIPCDMCRNDHRNDPICKSHQGDCSECSLHCPCDGCFDFWEMELKGSNFVWRGVCPANTEVQGDG